MTSRRTGREARLFGIATVPLTGAAVLIAAAALGCQEGRVGPPPPLALAAAPTEVWSGGEVEVTSPALEDLRLIPGTDYALLIEGDTLGSWRPSWTTLATVLPPLFSGHYWLTLALTDGRRDSARIRVIGEAGESRQAYGLLEAKGLGGTTSLGSVEWALPGDPWGYGVLDLETGALDIIPALDGRDLGMRQPMMYVPGPSYRPGYVLMDMSLPTVPRPVEVWQSGNTASVFRYDHDLDCRRQLNSGYYTAAELADGACFLLDDAGVVRKDGVPVLADSGLVHGEFRFSPGAAWLFIATRYRRQIFHRHLSAWPVFRGNGELAYTIPGLAEVAGVAFSSTGDTLYAVVARPDTTTDSLRWSAEIFETATGRLLAALTIPDVAELLDIVLDPELERAYVPYRTGVQDPDRYSLDTWRGMAVLDRATWSLIASVPARGIYASYFDEGGMAQFERATHRVYVLHFDSFNENVTMHTYDTR